MQDLTYDVRVYKTEVYKGKKVTTYYVRWKTGGKQWKEPFRKAAQADSFRSSLLAAARNGEAFSLNTGRPLSWKREESAVSWYTLTLDYTAAKWPYASPNHRRGIAEALTDATEVMLIGDGPHSRDEIRRALRTWAFSARLRGVTEPPANIGAVVRWLEGNTVPVKELAQPGSGAVRVRALLDRISRTKDGSTAAASTATRKRMTLTNIMQYAIEINVLPDNPLRTIKWNKPRTLKTVDPRVVVNSGQARRFLDAVRAQGERGARMVAFFGCMYYAALRPEEAVDLRRENLVSLPDEGWGEMLLTHSEPRSGSQWTNNGLARERRELKHRAPGETRPVPIHPELVRLLLDHLKEFGSAPDGRVFAGPRGGILTDRAYLAVFHDARATAFTDEETTSLAARRPYDLRHAAVSTWLTAGVAPPQIAEWAGHSVDVLLRVYAKCIAGQQEEAKRRILAATQSGVTEGLRAPTPTAGIPHAAKSARD
ncbi:site-specific integrase [Actinoallomurus acanthiterrae]